MESLAMIPVHVPNSFISWPVLNLRHACPATQPITIDLGHNGSHGLMRLQQDVGTDQLRTFFRGIFLASVGYHLLHSSATVDTSTIL